MNTKSVFVISFLLYFTFLFFIIGCTSPVEKLYLDKCSKCHGENGMGKAANVNFTRQKFSIEDIKKSIVHGKGEMANIPGIKEPELSQLANYVTGLYQNQ